MGLPALRIASALAIAATAFLLYAGTSSFPFVLDDVRNIHNNPSIRWQELSLENLRQAALESPTRRFVANWSFGLNYWWDGERTAGYRAVNVLLHGLNGIFVYALALVLYRRRTSSRPGPASLEDPRTRHAVALCAALLFVAHPLQTQSVTYLVQRMNLLAAGFSLASALCFLRGREIADPRRRFGWWTVAAAAWLLGIGRTSMS